MTGHRIVLKGFKLKDGKLVPCNKHKDVSARLREKGSKKVIRQTWSNQVMRVVFFGRDRFGALAYETVIVLAAGDDFVASSRHKEFSVVYRVFMQRIPRGKA